METRQNQVQKAENIFFLHKCRIWKLNVNLEEVAALSWAVFFILLEVLRTNLCIAFPARLETTLENLEGTPCLSPGQQL